MKSLKGGIILIIFGVVSIISILYLLIFAIAFENLFSNTLTKTQEYIANEALYSVNHQIESLHFAMQEIAKKKPLINFVVDNSPSSYEYTYELLSKEKLLLLSFKFSIYDALGQRTFYNDDCDLTNLLPISEFMSGNTTRFAAINNKGNCKRIVFATPLLFRDATEGILVGTVDIKDFFNAIFGKESTHYGSALVFDNEVMVSTSFVSDHFKDFEVQGLSGVQLRSYVNRNLALGTRVRTYTYTSISFLLLMIVSIGVVVFYLAPIATRPLLKIQSEVKNIASDRSLRLKSSTSIAEVRELAVAFNELLDQLQDFERENLMKAHKAGIAENAVSVLHNIGNILTAMGMRLDNNSCCGKGAHVSEMLGKVAALIKEKIEAGNIESFFASEKGKQILDLLNHLKSDLESSGLKLKDDISFLQSNIQHISAIITIQQNYAAHDLNVKTVVYPKTIVDDILKLKRDYILAHNIEVNVDLDPNATIKVNSYGLAQAITNFLVNSFESVLERFHKDNKPPSVSVLVKRIEDNVFIKVEDNGMGIDESQMDKIFKFGYSTKQRSSGFGLHDCSNFVQANNGEISAKSEGPLKGAIITLIFPAVDIS